VLSCLAPSWQAELDFKHYSKNFYLIYIMKKSLSSLRISLAFVMFGFLMGWAELSIAAQNSSKAGMTDTFINDTGGPLALLPFNMPYCIAVDVAGNVYVTDAFNNRIRKITPQGEPSTLAGGKEGFADGVGNNARFKIPAGIVIDKAGNLYVADSNNDRIRKITPSGEVSTFAGSEYGFTDGVGSNAKFRLPIDIAIDKADNLYVADSENNSIRKITPAGEVSTLAGSEQGFADDVGTAAQFKGPAGIAVDAVGNIYVADSGNNRIRKITSMGEVSTLAGSEEGFADGVGAAAKFNHPRGIVIDAWNNLYVTDSNNHRIRKITSKGDVSTFAGGGVAGRRISGIPDAFADGPGSVARFFDPHGIAIDIEGNLYVADYGNYRIRKITPKGDVSTFGKPGGL
jgi:sugar lactone lactonase YvrE